MQLFTITAFLISLSAAVPTTLQIHHDKALCPPGLLYSSPQCCATDFAGVASFDCETLSDTPDATNTFLKICADQAKQPRCCSFPLLRQGILCQAPVANGR